MRTVLCFFTTLLLSTCAIHIVNSPHKTFVVDYNNNQFLKDGEPFRYISGSVHYFRVPRPYWRDRLRKCKAAGLNAVQTYIEWSLHETSPGVYDFSGDKDVAYFIKIAKEEGLLVILRPGPYICAERSYGGYPTWLIHQNPRMVLRTSDTSHTFFVNKWLDVLFQIIQPLLYGNGGPVIMVQVENEYGSYPICDRSYTKWLRDVFRKYVEDKAVLFTTDGNGDGYLKCGPIPGVFTTVDFGPYVENVTEAFAPLRRVQRGGPLVNSEFYAGQLTHWGDEGMSKVSTEKLVNSTRQLIQMNASFNFYMFHGGTNFGFSSGANNPPFRPVITSYDFDAPISESGHLTEKYFALKSVISEFYKIDDVLVEPSQTEDYGTLELEPKISLFDSNIGTKYDGYTSPLTFERLQIYSGLVLYETFLPHDYAAYRYLEVLGGHDRTIVYVDKKLAGVLSRSDDINSLMISGGETLGLLVENQGYIGFGNMSDKKGIINGILLEGCPLYGWNQTCYPLTNVSEIPSLPTVERVNLPAFYVGRLRVPSSRGDPQDTFVDMTGWGKGFIYVNDFNLGRYWPARGPQITVYLPGIYLREDNVVVVLELEKEHPNRTIRFVSKPGSTGVLH